MTTDVAEALSLAKDAEASVARGNLFMVNNSANWRPTSRKAHEVVSLEGALGQIQHVTAFFASPLMSIFDNPSPDLHGWNKSSGLMSGNGFGWGQQVSELEANALAPSWYCSQSAG